MNDGWLQHAACRDRDICPDPGIFFPGDGEQTKALEAKKICAACPVRPTCLRYALANNEKDGVWGGTTVRERRRMRKTGNFDRFCKACGMLFGAGVEQRRREFCDGCGKKRLAERQREYNLGPKRAS